MAEIDNADLMREIKSVQREQIEAHKLTMDHEKRLRRAENFIIAYEAAQKALSSTGATRGYNVNSDFTKVVYKFIALLTALIGLFYLIIQSYASLHH